MADLSIVTKKNKMKEVEMSVRMALPDSMSYQDKCRLLEKLADEYRRKSRKDIEDSVNRFKSKK